MLHGSAGDGRATLCGVAHEVVRAQAGAAALLGLPLLQRPRGGLAALMLRPASFAGGCQSSGPVQALSSFGERTASGRARVHRCLGSVPTCLLTMLCRVDSQAAGSRRCSADEAAG
jgi:hypothetical protein